MQYLRSKCRIAEGRLNHRVNGNTQNHAHRVICLQRRQIIIICTSTV